MISIAIDGPAGAGKSTIAKRLAARFGCIYVDTGALYRTVAYGAVKSGILPEDTDGVLRLIGKTEIDIAYRDGEQIVLLNGENVSAFIRTPEISEYASRVSAVPQVRAFLLGLQRKLATEHDVVMDGRDIATVVLPSATVKIFLTASAEKRARRRYDELVAKGMDVKFEDVLGDLLERDHRDSIREIAPLKPAEDSITVDTTDLVLEEAIDAAAEVIENVLKSGDKN